VLGTVGRKDQFPADVGAAALNGVRIRFRFAHQNTGIRFLGAAGRQKRGCKKEKRRKQGFDSFHDVPRFIRIESAFIIVVLGLGRNRISSGKLDISRQNSVK
jgi:hypothetical protein